MNTRVKSLRERRFAKSSVWEGFADQVFLDVDRGILFTEAYRASEGKPEVVRRALALKNLLENIPIWVKPGELIVGHGVNHPRAIIGTYELSDVAVKECKEDGYVRKEDIPALEKVIDYWQNKNLWTRVQELGTFREEELWSNANAFMGLSLTSRDGYGTSAPDFEFVFKHGLEGIIEMIDANMASLMDEAYVGTDIAEKAKKKYQWMSMKIAAEAAITWSKRFAGMLRNLAAIEEDSKQKEDYLKVADVCERCLEYPVDSFHGAVQAHWFIQLITHHLERFAPGPSVRIDQILNPYYEKDIKAGKLTREEALEMIELLWVKEQEGGYAQSRNARRNWQGSTMLQIYTLGGVDAKGMDACNEITKLCMEATRDCRTTQPSYCLRVHPKVPDEYLRSAFESVKTGMAIPSFENDTVVIPALMNHFGYTLEEARSWALILCKSPGATGPKGTTRRRPNSLNCTSPVSVILNNGVDPYKSGLRFGPETHPEKFKTMEEVYEAYSKQIAIGLQMAWKFRNVAYEVEAEYLQQPFLSCCFKPFIDKGVDCMDHDELPAPWFNALGMICAGDSMVAIDKLVFIDKKYTMAELCDALRKDWEGYEQMRQDFINAPKWGNDDDYADAHIDRVYNIVIDEGLKMKDRWGASPRALPQALTAYRGSGYQTGATPDGRKAGDVLDDGGTSPYHGRDKKGPTAVLKSVSKLDNSRARASLLNQRLQPAMLQGEKGWQMFRAYIKTWHDLMIEHVQINVVDNSVLRAAQTAPEKFPDLVVRVAGYSAYFTQLDKGTQDSIMARTEQVLA